MAKASGGDVEFTDLLQLACTGLLEAIDRYDASRGAPFEGYAIRRINGSMLSGIAKMNEVREQIACRSRIRRDRVRSLATAGAAELPKSEAMAALIDLAMGLAVGFMLDDTSLYMGAVEPSGGGAYESLAWKQTRQRLLAELALIPDREQMILRHHYLEGIALDVIAELLGLSKGRVSQLHKGAIALLRKRLTNAPGFTLQR